MTAFGAYELGRRLGAGGMGEVFLARRLADGQQVVIKRVLPGLASRPGFVERFLHEVQVLARLHSPCIVRVFDFGEVDGRWFLAMEHVEGLDVAAWLARGPVSLSAACRVVLEGASGLMAAHGARDAAGRATPVVHRDVSPHNLLVDLDGSVKLIDFGVASLGGQGESGGKLAYAAPEQLMDELTSPHGDQYSLGVVAWECLAGQRAFGDVEDVELIRLVTEVGVRPLPASVPSSLAALVQRMTALAPSARFGSMSEVREAWLEVVRGLRLEVGPAALASRAVVEQARPVLPLPAPGDRERQPLSVVETAALGVIRDGMSAEEAEAAIDARTLDGAPFALDVLQGLVEKGALRAEDRDGERRFFR